MATISGEDSSGTTRTIKTDSSGRLDILTSTKEDYTLNDVEESGHTTYIGLAKSDGTWLIRKIVESSTLSSIRYANISNNSAYTTYSSAWADRTSLTYEQIEELTF